MTSSTPSVGSQKARLSTSSPFWLHRYLPFTDWLFHYSKPNLAGDVLAGIIVAIMLVPQSMAYALLAGLPPQVGLYASIAPVMIYGLLGSSRVLAVGPVAMVSLLVASGVSSLAEPGSPQYLQAALLLALMVGGIQLGMGILRLGIVANFLSHSVLTAFTAAAALIIASSQLRHLFGIPIPNSESILQVLWDVGSHLDQVNLVTLGLGLGSILVMVYFKTKLGSQLQALPQSWRIPISKSGPLVAVIVTTVTVVLLGLADRAGVRVVGQIPPGLPPIGIPAWDLSLMQALLPTALAISLVGFMESFAVGQSLASRRRQTVDPDQDLIGLGAANLLASLTGGYPVTGGISRSVVNFAAGANTGLASLITASLVGLTVLFLMPLFTFLPQTTLAAIVLVAVVSLIDIHPLLELWRYDRSGEARVWILTFLGVLAVGIEIGILIGVLSSLGLHLWRSSRPHVAIVGRVGDSEHFRNILRHEVTTHPHLLSIRVDESLYFANARYLENYVMGLVADQPAVTQLLLICSAVNHIDASALETLFSLKEKLTFAGVQLHFAEIKGPVMDHLKQIHFIEKIAPGSLFLSTHDAVEQLAHQDNDLSAAGQLRQGA